MSIVFTDLLTAAGDLNGVIPGRQAIAVINGRTFVVAAADTLNANDPGITIAELSANGALTLVDQVGTLTNPLDGYAFGAGGIAVLDTGSTSYVYMQVSIAPGNPVTIGRAMMVLELDATGALSVIQRIDDLDAFSGIVAQNGTGPGIATVGGRNFLIQPSGYGDELVSYYIRSDGRLAARDVLDIPGGAANNLDVVSVGQASYVISAGPWNSAPIQVHRITKSGAFVNTFDLSVEEPLIYNNIINDFETTKINGRTFVFVSENTRFGITAFELKGGRLELVGHELPGVGDAWGPATLDSFEVGGQTFLAAGGFGNGLGVFAVSDEGALTEVDEYFFAGGSLRWANVIEAVDVGGQQYLTVTSPYQDSLRAFRFVADDPPISGGNGNNTLRGTVAEERVFGNGGADRIYAGAGDDLGEGGDGDDLLKGDLGNDDLYGGNGRDTVYGQDGNDWLFGGNSADRVFGGNQNDFARGGAGNDLVSGNDGNDRAFGDDGDDRLYGGTGIDTLSDGTGLDRLYGGIFADIFVMADDGQTDQILDFEDGIDTIDLRAEGPGLSFPDLVVAASGTGVRIDYGDDRLILRPASGMLLVTDISLDDFIFV